MEKVSMWIRKSTPEAIVGNWTSLLRIVCLDVLVGVSLWYVLVRLFILFAVLPRDSVSGCVGCAVVAVLLPAAWLHNRRAQRDGKNTLVCDHCNRVKLADNQLRCECGGQYFTLAEMKWIERHPIEKRLQKSA